MNQGLNLKLYRIQNGVKQMDIASLLRDTGLKIDSSRISRYEKGTLKLSNSLETKIRLAIDELKNV